MHIEIDIKIKHALLQTLCIHHQQPMFMPMDNLCLSAHRQFPIPLIAPLMNPVLVIHGPVVKDGAGISIFSGDKCVLDEIKEIKQ